MKTYRLHLPTLLQDLGEDERSALMEMAEPLNLDPLEALERITRGGLRAAAQEAGDPPPRVERVGEHLEVQAQEGRSDGRLHSRPACVHLVEAHR